MWLYLGNALAVQWLRFCTFTFEGMGSIPGQGTKIQASSAAQVSLKNNK